MRDLKFRAWDSFNRKMVIDNESVLRGLLFNVQNNGALDTLKFMQYTGLKDKNGREIYEGDIISGVTKQNLEVVFQQGSFGMNVMMRVSFHKDERKPFFTTLNCYESVDLEVIGNIYEKPELLEETK